MSECGPDRHDRPNVVPPVSDKNPTGSSGPSSAATKSLIHAGDKLADLIDSVLRGPAGKPVDPGLVHELVEAVPEWDRAVDRWNAAQKETKANV